MSGPALSAAQIAVALVAAARITGVDPARVFEPATVNRRTRIIAAAGCAARLGGNKKTIAGLFRVFGSELAPSMLIRGQIDSDHLLIVAEALHVNGLTEGDDPRGRFLSPEGWSAVPDQVRDDKVEPRDTQLPAAEAARPAPLKAVLPAARTGDRKASPRPTEATVAAARPAARQAVRRLKPLTDRVVGWAGWFLEARIWTVEEVADLFDVDPDALLRVLENDGAIA